MDHDQSRATEGSAVESAEKEADAKEPLPLNPAQALKPGWNKILISPHVPSPSVGAAAHFMPLRGEGPLEPRPTAKVMATKPGKKLLYVIWADTLRNSPRMV